MSFVLCLPDQIKIVPKPVNGFGEEFDVVAGACPPTTCPRILRVPLRALKNDELGIGSKVSASVAPNGMDRALGDFRHSLNVMQDTFASHATQLIGNRSNSVLEPSRMDLVSLGVRIADADRHDRWMKLFVVVEWDCYDRHAFIQLTKNKLREGVSQGRPAGDLQSRGTQFSPNASQYSTNT